MLELIAAQGYTQHIEATSASLERKECPGCNQARRPTIPKYAAMSPDDAAFQLHSWLGVNSRAGRSVGPGGSAFGPRCNPGTPSCISSQ